MAKGIPYTLSKKLLKSQCTIGNGGLYYKSAMDAAKVETVVTSAMISRFILAIAAVLVVDALCSTPIAEELVVISAVLVVVVAFRAVIAFEVVVYAL